jgi:hypothetical protein
MSCGRDRRIIANACPVGISYVGDATEAIGACLGDLDTTRSRREDGIPAFAEARRRERTASDGCEQASGRYGRRWVMWCPPASAGAEMRHRNLMSRERDEGCARDQRRCGAMREGETRKSVERWRVESRICPAGGAVQRLRRARRGCNGHSTGVQEAVTGA